MAFSNVEQIVYFVNNLNQSKVRKLTDTIGFDKMNMDKKRELVRDLLKRKTIVAQIFGIVDVYKNIFTGFANNIDSTKCLCKLSGVMTGKEIIDKILEVAFLLKNLIFEFRGESKLRKNG